VHDLQKNRIDIIDTASFVNDDVFETEFLEGRFLDEADIIARYAHFEMLWAESVHDVFVLFFGSGEDDDVHI
jgi:hypothetical protein